MVVDADLFPTTIMSMIDAYLPKDKRKGKAEFIQTQYVLRQNARLRLKVDLSSDEPPRYFSNPVYAESMLDSSTKKTDRPMVLCNWCKSSVIITKSN
ncbi:hypothetical protein TB1_032481 [Malus domestica]